MSSLAAARADNFYNPPDWDPSKGSRNKYHGSHGALGDRARKLDQGILIIRFEMPFNVWCAGCSHLIGKGVRFNAEKKQVGSYHSTKIWSFVMRSPCCQQRIEVRTDPKAGEYIVVTGGRRKAEPVEEPGEGRVALDPEARAQRLADPISRLEHEDEDRRAGRKEHEELATMQQGSSARHRHDYQTNRELRRRMRGVRKEEQARDARRDELGLPQHITLAPETATDRLRASAVSFGSAKFSKGWKHDRATAVSSSIFSPSAVAAATGKRPSGQGGPLSGLQQKRRRLDSHVRLTLANPDQKRR